MKQPLGVRLSAALTRQRLVPLRPVVAPCTLNLRVCNSPGDTLANLVVDCSNPWEKVILTQLHMIANGDQIFFPLYKRRLFLGDPAVETQLHRQLTHQLCDGVLHHIDELEHSEACLKMDIYADRPYINTTGLVERIGRIQQIRAALVIIQNRLAQHLVTIP